MCKIQLPSDQVLPLTNWRGVAIPDQGSPPMGGVAIGEELFYLGDPYYYAGMCVASYGDKGVVVVWRQGVVRGQDELVMRFKCGYFTQDIACHLDVLSRTNPVRRRT